MDAVLGKDCVNEVCHALKSQTAKDVLECNKRTQVPNEVVGRGGECKSTQDRELTPITNISQGFRRSPAMFRLRIDKGGL